MYDIKNISLKRKLLWKYVFARRVTLLGKGKSE